MKKIFKIQHKILPPNIPLKSLHGCIYATNSRNNKSFSHCIDITNESYILWTINTPEGRILEKILETNEFENSIIIPIYNENNDIISCRY